MPTSTYIALSNTTLSGTATSITFSSIPDSYRDLVLVVTGRVNDYDWLSMQFNSDTGSNYSYVFMLGDGANSSSGSNTTTRAWFGRFSSGAGKISTSFANIMDYSATNKHKTILGSGNAPDDLTAAIASRWASNTAISSIKVLPTGAAVFASGTTFALYGIES